MRSDKNSKIASWENLFMFSRFYSQTNYRFQMSCSSLLGHTPEGTSIYFYCKITDLPFQLYFFQSFILFICCQNSRIMVVHSSWGVINTWLPLTLQLWFIIFINGTLDGIEFCRWKSQYFLWDYDARMLKTSSWLRLMPLSLTFNSFFSLLSFLHKI